jgi:lysophospholipase L1-like esterase
MHTYLALGDSYTCGEAIPSLQSFPQQLTATLREQGLELADPTIVAVTGWTTDELQQAIAEKQLEQTYDFVTLLIGANNQYRGPARGFTPQSYQTGFAGLLQTAIGFAGGHPDHVVVVSIPDWGATPFAAGQERERIAQEIDAYNAINKAESKRLGAHYVDITPLSRQAANNPSLVASDDLHYAGSMYAQWVQSMLPQVEAALADSK